MECSVLWSKACKLLEQRMNPVLYTTWIRDSMVPVSFAGGVMKVKTIMPAMKDTIQSRYIPEIEIVLREVYGQGVTMQLLTEAELAQQEKEAKKAALSANTTAFTSSEVHLNPNYTFDTFVVGNNNRFAHACAVAVAEAPAETWNPLFIYGGVGLGKTHLMHAIGHFILSQDPSKRILYTTSEAFTNELITAIQHSKNNNNAPMNAFRDRFRNVDVLMIDDIQFIAGKDSTQEEFFHTFNSLHSAGKQIILTSDKPPRDIARLEERLRTRFDWGITVDVRKPDLETRIAILREKCVRDSVVISDDVLALIAENIENNIRDLEGSLNKLVAFAQFSGKPISVELCQDALRDAFEKRSKRVITAELISRVVAEYYSISVEDLTGKSRRREVTVPRQIAIFLTREMTNMSLPQIGVAFGGRDHSTIIHSCTAITEGQRDTQTDLGRQVNDIRQMILDN